MAEKLEDGKSDCAAGRGAGWPIKTGMGGAFQQGLDEEVGTDVKVGKSKELIYLVQAGEVSFDRVRM